MTLKNRLGGHTNSYHTYSLEEALEGIAAAGYRYVELSAVRGWTEHVPLEADAKELGRIQRMMNSLGLVSLSLSGHSDLTTKEGLADGLLAVDLCERMGIGIMNTAIGGHYSEDEDEDAFMGNIHELADYAAARDIRLGIEIHGEITKSGAAAIPVLERIGRPNVLINYDTANVEFYGDVKAVDDLPIALPKMVHCHLKDKRGEGRVWDFPGIGDGDIDFARILGIIEKGGYEGPLSVEIEFLGEPWPALEEVNRSMKASHDRLAALGLS
ncbi:MAG: sugar phosphate isomerase/epimerase [Bauldia sp.]|uniref:sugar phosphate isomerase/epimerase family protein n=1 Tax=Bauldia sp. TaxID=2575872 RepID=UPI001D1A9209|nr:sugar phosphate isomerase/epimerase family protein [Bauldia sp.]MCB1496779.1 sugar phosphate isomerase/epimerase [Bauldia sp.]